MSIFKYLGKMIFHSLFMSSVMSLSINVMAEQLDPASKEALEKTVKLLANRAQREKVMIKDPNAVKADEMAKNLVGDGAELEKLYKLAGSVFRNVANENSGDTTDMLKTLEKAQSNPQDFLNKLNPQQRKMIEELSQHANSKQANP